MSDRSPDGPRPGGWVPPPADATRDIRLPPVADRPGPAVRPEWAPYVAASPKSTHQAPVPQTAQAPPVVDQAPPVIQPAPVEQAREPEQAQPHDPPTDRLAAPHDRARSSTLAFQPPPQVQLLKVSVRPSRRSGWLWALAIIVPLLIILGSGLWLVLLFYGR